MSMNSKVSLALRNAIISFLKPGTSATNQGLKAHVANPFSLRAVQEATQKLTREGVLTQTKSKGKTWYGVNQRTFKIQAQGKDPNQKGWFNSMNAGTTGLFTEQEARDVIALQLDLERVEYRVVPSDNVPTVA
jgi:hypothetical protein